VTQKLAGLERNMSFIEAAMASSSKVKVAKVINV
jgi:hypothetical protein